MSDEEIEDEVVEGPFWSTGGIDAGNVAQYITGRYISVNNFDINSLVYCAVCDKRYMNYYPEGGNTQGLGCETDWNNGHLIGGYGGAFDMLVLSVTGLDPTKRIDPICDLCVIDWIRQDRVMYKCDLMSGTPNKHVYNWFMIGYILGKQEK